MNIYTVTLERCPHCNVAHPTLIKQYEFKTEPRASTPKRWVVYYCTTCGSVISFYSRINTSEVEDYFPKTKIVKTSIPSTPREYLKQAVSCIHAPAGAVMLAASAVDSMLKEIGLTEGTLNNRIKQAASEGLITKDMAAWAHEVRLDANDQRHADENASMPTENDVNKAISFAEALAEYLFVLPSMIEEGRRK